MKDRSGVLVSLLLLFKAENIVDSLDEEKNERLPGEKISNPIEQLSVKQVWLLPRIAEEFLEVDFLLAVWASLLLADDEPATYAKPKEEIIKLPS